jgi:2-keto-4-pentenoate hydratase/2-oxohepta-3-ene-1,7-dioic acid hydratase in catechol pathway
MKFIKFLDESGYSRTGTLHDEIIRTGSRRYDPDSVTVLPPVTPSKIVCVGLNYANHAEETDSPLPDRPKLFLKTPNTVTAHDRVINLPHSDHRYDPEAELGVVIDQQASEVPASDAFDYVRGYTCVNDLSNRTDQRVEQNWVRGKAFDNAAPVGPVLVDPESVPASASIQCRVNGDVRQSASRNDMIFSIPELVEEITQHLTLEPEDVIATGTPSGVAPLEENDTVEIEIEGIGTLRNTITFG